MLTITDILTYRFGLAGGGAMSLAFQGDGDMLLPKDSLFQLINHFPILFPFRYDGATSPGFIRWPVSL
jgi:hypothetical protein